MKTKNRLATFGAALAAIIASTGINTVAPWSRTPTFRPGVRLHGNPPGKTYPINSKRECDRRLRQKARDTVRRVKREARHEEAQRWFREKFGGAA